MPIIYGIVVFRRIATVDDYHHPHNAKHYGFSQDTGSLYDPSRMSLNADPAAMYDPADTAVDRPRRPSLTFKRTATDDSSKRSSVSSQPRPSEERRSSYDHKRDTQYDEYVARRKSSGEEDRQSLPSRSRGNSLTQPASWELNLGDATTVPGGSVQRGHSLVSVPEAVEADVETAHTSRNQTPPIGEDWQGMLNGQRTPSTGASSYVSRDSRLGSSQGWQEDELHFQKTRRYS